MKKGFFFFVLLLALMSLAGPGIAQDEVVIYFEPGSYYPAEPTEDNPFPPTVMNDLVDEYEATHPGVRIELVEVPQNLSEDQWRITGFQGGNEPHILFIPYIRAWQELVNDWYLPLNDFIEEPNPYVPEGTPGADKWKDIIPDVVWNTTLDSNGNQYVITTEAVAVGFFYNKAMLEKAGVDTEFDIPYSLWRNWEAMLVDMKTLAEAGLEPVAMTMNPATPYSYNWIDGVSLTSLYHDKIESMWEPGATWHALNQREFACAIQNGIVSAYDPEFSDWIDVLSGFEPYWIDGYTSATADEIYRLFINGEVPFYLTNAASDMQRVLRDANFEFGLSYFPPIDGETSPYAANVDTAYLVGGFTIGMAVTERAEREGITPQVIDFLKYITAQPQWERVIVDAPRSVPTLVGMDVPLALQPLTSFLQLPIRALKDPDPRLTKRYGEEHRRLMQEYFTKQIDKDTLISEEDRLLRSEAAKATAEGDWTCDFQVS